MVLTQQRFYLLSLILDYFEVNIPQVFTPTFISRNLSTPFLFLHHFPDLQYSCSPLVSSSLPCAWAGAVCVKCQHSPSPKVQAILYHFRQRVPRTVPHSTEQAALLFPLTLQVMTCE